MAINNAVNANQAGVQCLTSAGVWNGRTLTAGTGISITNGDGVSGNPTISATSGETIGTFNYFATDNNTTYPNPEWLLCDGSIVSQATYTDLYSKVGLLQNGLWTMSVSTRTVSNLAQSVAYGNNLFVLGGATGSIETSVDGITWTARTSGTASTIRTITYGNGIFVYGGNGGVLATSTDAITWTARTSGTTSSIYNVVYVNNLYIYGGIGGALATSTDAITWTARTSGTTNRIQTITFGNNLYVYGGSGGAIGYSTDAITWTVSIIDTGINSVVYKNNTFFIAGVNIYATSTNGSTFSFANEGTRAAIAYQYIDNVGSYLVGTTSEGMYTSTDGNRWSKMGNYLPVTPTSGVAVFASGNNLFVMSATSAATSTVYYTNIFTYNTATQFALPLQRQEDSITASGVSQNLYIRAL